MNRLARAAVAYATELRWPVLPLQPGGKAPLTLHGFHDATCGIDQIREWWRKWPHANVGLACCVKSGLLALDIDPRNFGHNTMEDLEARYGPTVTVRRAPS